MHRARYLAAAALAVAIPTQAQDEIPAYAETASEFANAVYRGFDPSALPSLPNLSQAEIAELETLAGCKGAVAQGGTRNLVAFNWTCGPRAEAAVTWRRSTALRFNNDGEIFAVEINPLEADFAPSDRGKSLAELPPPRDTAKAFAKAVKSGGMLR